MIPLSIPNLGAKEQEALQKCLNSGWISSAGPDVKLFEEKLAAYCGRRFAIATVNGTAALHLALLALGIQAGDYILVPNLTFVASVNPIRYCGAEPILVDVDPQNWQINLDLLERFLVEGCEVREGLCMHKASDRPVRAILAVDVHGYMPDWDRLESLAEAHGIALIEDAAEALGSRIGDRTAGSFGKISTLSFNGNKIISSAGGGMLLTDDDRIARKARHLANQAKRHQQEYLHDEVGYNYRLPNLNAALGLAQMEQLEAFLQRKREVYAFYDDALGQLHQIQLYHHIPKGHFPNHWLYTVLAEDSRQLEEYLISHDIETRKMWVPMDRLGMYANCQYLSEKDHAFKIYNQSLSLPCSTGITDQELEKVADAVRGFYS